MPGSGTDSHSAAGISTVCCQNLSTRATRRDRAMARDHLPPVREVPDEVETVALHEIELKRCVGGLVASSERKAAQPGRLRWPDSQHER